VHFLPEQIEILWIIPVIALVIFIFIIQLIAQKKEQTGLSREVAQFNNGAFPINKQYNGPGSDRLSQLEKAISTITDSLSVQQQTINQFSKGTIDYTSEINNLKIKLRELYKEYDIVLSENYSLKAKVKKLQENDAVNNGKIIDETSGHQQIAASDGRVDVLLSSKVDMKLYEDTRTLNLALLDDTSEIDLSDLTRRIK
jgi:hypothetical protein